ncbi:MAG TPA: UbiD family decarboxylase [Nitrososphaerales archaeon]|nr:UbiD family decarboxylase [Nitrososphaerales archaeon]
MKEFLSSLKADESLTTINDKVSPEFQISSVLARYQERPFLFENVSGSSIKVAGNLLSTRKNVELGLGIEKGSLLSSLESAIRHPTSKGHVSNFRRSEWAYSGEADLTKLPILAHFQNEAGKYITAGIVAVKYPGTDIENLSFHRMLVLSKNKVAARIVPRHLYQIAKETGGKVSLSVIVGPPPSVFVAGSLQVQYGQSEYEIANSLSGGNLKLVSSEQTGIAVPVDSEVVLEGVIDFTELTDEGPFVDLTGTYDDVRKQPVITFERMHCSSDAVYQAVVASTREHSLFMGLPQELKIREILLKAITKIRGINLTPAGSGYFHCVVSIEKSGDGDGKTAIMNCLAASHPLKLVIAVDSDVDPFNLEEVEWALSTRFQAATGLLQINGARGSSLDPSSAKSGVTSKIGLDATLPVSQDRKKFERAKITQSSATKTILDKLERS